MGEINKKNIPNSVLMIKSDRPSFRANIIAQRQQQQYGCGPSLSLYSVPASKNMHGTYASNLQPPVRATFLYLPWCTGIDIQLSVRVAASVPCFLSVISQREGVFFFRWCTSIPGTNFKFIMPVSMFRMTLQCRNTTLLVDRPSYFAECVCVSVGMQLLVHCCMYRSTSLRCAVHRYFASEESGSIDRLRYDEVREDI